MSMDGIKLGYAIAISSPMAETNVVRRNRAVLIAQSLRQGGTS